MSLEEFLERSSIIIAELKKSRSTSWTQWYVTVARELCMLT